jgi:hypothetical protein
MPLLGLFPPPVMSPNEIKLTDSFARLPAAVYLEHGQQKTVNPGDQEPDRTYEWFY